MRDLSAETIFGDIVPRFIASNPDFPPKVDAVVCVEIVGDGGGEWTIDLTHPPEVRCGLDGRARCAMRVSSEDFHALVAQGSVGDWLDAFKRRRIEFSGHLPTAMKLQRLFASVVDDPRMRERFRMDPQPP